jgi:hypothetical protein
VRDERNAQKNDAFDIARAETTNQGKACEYQGKQQKPWVCFPPTEQQKQIAKKSKGNFFT